MKKLLKELFNHERFQSISFILAGCLLIWFYGCESKVTSLQDPGKLVSRAELQAELEYMISIAEVRYSALERQDQLKSILLSSIAVVASGGTVNPLGVATSLAAVLGLGAGIDNVRKRKELKKAITYVPIDRPKDNPTNSG